MPVDESCKEYHQAVFSDAQPENYCVLNYEGKKVVPLEKGEGGLDACVAHFSEDKVCYAFVRMTKTDDLGDSVRTKFVFLVWSGESASPLTRGKVTGDLPEVGALFKGHHIKMTLTDKSDLKNLQAKVEDTLKKAGGANYDLGSTRSGITAENKTTGGASEYKKKTKEFFENKEKESTIGNVEYFKGPASKGLTPQDLSGRAMTVGQSQAKDNIKDEWSLHKDGEKPEE
eukprot:Lithocolla_globosa_v1_NODE_3495_length_1656_cov_279.743285.p1 type:complete len:229 gc:universal NODE_3495_length_1656_cov_279.743285:732-46(-)